MSAAKGLVASVYAAVGLDTVEFDTKAKTPKGSAASRRVRERLAK